MRVLQVNRSDLIGQRFNGFNLADRFEARGVEPRYLVWEKQTDDSRVARMLPYPGSRRFARVAHRLETEFSRHAELPLHSHALPLHSVFRGADVVHYHIIHDGYFSLLSLPQLTRQKPSVWTWHDPWPMTGHCIYPLGCERWKIGCGECPDLTLHFPMQQDRTREAAAMKRRVVTSSDVDIVLASRYMLDMARNSFVGANARLHHIPFGIDLEVYRQRDRAACRARFGVPEENVVIALRSFSSTFKGLPEMLAAFEALQTSQPITIIGFQEYGHFNRFIGRHQIVELGWVDDDALMVDALSAADLFLMPSKAEAFGMMAAEAMACAKPVIVFEGTSLPEVVFAPEAGIAVPMGDSHGLMRAIQLLVDQPEERRRRGALSRKLAEQHYSLDTYADRLVALYAEVAARRSGRGQA